jgi:DNA-binding MarR family transcriptional regulator
VTAQSMADMVTALLDRGLIERHRDPADRRRLVIALTPAGQGLLDDLRPAVASLERRTLSLLTDAEADDLRRSVELCRQALRRPDTGAGDVA